MKFVYEVNGLSAKDLYRFLIKCDIQFFPQLSSRVNLSEYSEKLFHNSTIINAKKNNEIIGIIAFYVNDNSIDYGFISLICVLNNYKGNGVGSNLMNECILLVKKKRLKSIKLEVDIENRYSMSFYRKFGFHVQDQRQNLFLMEKLLQ